MSKKLVVGFVLIFIITLFLLHIQNYFSNSKEIYEKSTKTTVQNFTSFKYKRFGSKWINKLVDENVSTNLKKLNIVTFNVMKSLYFFKERINQIIKHLAKDADVICLQEVTPTLVEYLQTLYVVQNKFEMSHIQGDSLDPFGVVVLSKIPIEKLTILKFPTKMNRNCLIGHFKINNEKLMIVNTQLESAGNEVIQIEQMKVISQFLKDFPDSLIVGDLGFGNEENKDFKQIFPKYQDIWSSFKKDKGFTFDAINNDLAKENPSLQVRSDRMYIQSKNWIPKSIEIIGDRPFMKDEQKGINIFPSSHFGLKTTIEFRK